jgi:hypothetical protein
MNASTVPIAKFRVGRIVATPNALRLITQEDIFTAIQRHQAGDWGEVESADSKANDQALVHGTRLLSAYTAQNGTRFWVITEADRSSTTILLPQDY